MKIAGMEIARLAEQFFNPIRANSRRAFEQSQVGGPSEPELVADSLLSMGAGMRNKFDFSHRATNNHQEFRILAEPMLESFAYRTKTQQGGVCIDFEGCNPENRIPRSHLYQIGSDRATRGGDGIVYQAWFQLDNGVANLYAKTS